MKTKALLLCALAAMPAALLCSSCIEDDWDGDYYGTRRPRYYDRYDDYDDGYRAGYEDRRRDERRYDRDRRREERAERDRREEKRDATPKPRIPKGFVRAGVYNAGASIEAPIPTKNPIKQILLAGTSGSPAINTVVLREGSGKTKFPLAVRLPAGETRMIELGGHRKATGIRVSTGGSGTFEVWVH